MSASSAPAIAQPLAAWGQAGSPRPAAASESVWLSEFRAAARRAFLASGFPKPSDDAWRHMGLEALLKPSWRLADADWNAQLPGVSGVDLRTWDRLSALPEPAVRKDRPAPFADLNATFFQNALHVRVPKSVCSLQPMRLGPAPIPAQTVDGWMIHPRASLQLEPGSRLDVIVDCGRLPDSSDGLLNLVLDVALAENTALNLVILGPSASQSVSLLDISVTQQRDSVFRAFCFESRPRLSRLDLSVALQGENASTDLFGLALLGGDSRAFHHLNVDHRVPHTQSQQIFKSVLSGAARFEYDSLVTIRPEAPRASSEQLNKNLVLSDGARAFARPQLAIQTDDVQCHHGATVGQMNAEELFYLRTRGIDPASASELVLRGFVDDLLEEVPVASVASELRARAHARLEEIAR